MKSFCMLTFLLAITHLTPMPARSQTIHQTVKRDSLQRQAVILLARGNLDSAAVLFQVNMQSGEGALGSLGMAKIAAIRGDWIGACKWADRALESDSTSMEIRYWNAIANREAGMSKSAVDASRALGISQREAFSRADRNFRWIMSRDSSYEGVLYQYYLLLKYQGHYDDAMRLLCAQIQSDPHFPNAFSAMRRLSNTAFREGRHLEIIAAVPPMMSPLRRWLEAEGLRLCGSLSQAELLLRDLTRSTSEIPPQLPYTSLLRLCVQTRDFHQLESIYRDAVAAIKDPSGALLLLEDLRYILTPDEFRRYYGNADLPRRQQFFSAVWNRRNPTPGTAWNPRLTEHYERLVFAERNYAIDRERYTFGSMRGFPGWNFDLQDAGLIFLRHGPPDEVLKLAEAVGSEAWLYHASGENGMMSFRFFGPHKSSGFASPSVTSKPMDANQGYRPFVIPPPPLESPGDSNANSADAPRVLSIPSDMVFWDPDYFHIFLSNRNQSELGRNRAQSRLETSIISSLVEGLRTERSAWSRSSKTFELSSLSATFRGPDGTTAIDLAYAIPGGFLLKATGDTTDFGNIESGFAIYGREWAPVVQFAETLSVSSFSATSNTFMRFQQAFVKPDSYYVSIFARPLGSHVVARSDRWICAPDFWLPQMAISDLELALKITRATEFNEFDKSGLRVVASPVRQHLTTQPLYVYFEIYNPTRLPNKQPDLGIDVRIRAVNEPSGLIAGIRRLFQQRKGYFVASEVERWNSPDVLAKYLVIDVTNMEPGECTLDISVTDKATHNTVSRSITIELLASSTSR